MTPLELLTFLRRHALLILVATLTTALLAGAATFTRTPSTVTTLLMAVAIADQSPTDHVYDAASQAREFAESVSGWFKSPQISSAIAEKAGFPLSASSTVQTKQNIIIELRYQQADGELAAVRAARDILDGELARYSKESKYRLTANLHGIATHHESRGTLTRALGGGVAGAILAILALLSYALITGRLIALSTITAITGPSAVAATVKDAPLLEQLIKQRGKDALLVGIDCDADLLARHLTAKVPTATLPQDAEALVKHAKSAILLVRFDTSTEKTLRLARLAAGTELPVIAL